MFYQAEKKNIHSLLKENNQQPENIKLRDKNLSV